MRKISFNRICLICAAVFVLLQSISLPSAKAEEDEDHPVLSYAKANPHWAFGLRTAFLKFPTSSAVGSSYELFGEYILPWQKFGVFSFGPYYGFFPIYFPEANVPFPRWSNLTAGGTVRYQLKLFTNQILVPTIGFDFNYFRVAAVDDSFYTGTDSGLRAGVLINLGWIDEMTAKDAYTNIGLCRSYITAEIRTTNMSMNNNLVTLSGNFWYWGLRLEFE